MVQHFLTLAIITSENNVAAAEVPYNSGSYSLRRDIAEKVTAIDLAIIRDFAESKLNTAYKLRLKKTRGLIDSSPVNTKLTS